MLWQDLRFGARMLLRSPGFTALALLTLALGIGANTTIFSVVNAVLLRPLPYPEPDRIVQVSDQTVVGFGSMPLSFPKFSALHDHARSFTALSATTFSRFEVTGPATAAPTELAGYRVSADFFPAFGVAPIAGRTFFPDEDRPGGNAVAVISYALWTNRFGSDPATVGQTIGIDGASTTIIGVMPPGFDFPANTALWLPRVFESNLLTRMQIQNGAGYLMLFGRLAPGVDSRTAQAEIATITHQYDADHRGFLDAGRSIQIVPLRESLVNDVRRTLLVLFGAVGFVLLIASANVANLLLARAVARQKEVAIRASLGASRGRLLTQFLTESVLLSILGSALGLLLSFWSIGFVNKLGPRMLAHAEQIHLDASVLLFTAAVAILTGLIFGLGPALHSSRLDLNDRLKASSRGIAGGGRLRGLMIVSEVAFAVILLTGAGLLMRSFLQLENVNPGFHAGNLLTMRIGLTPASYAQPAQRTAFYDRLLDRVSSSPGVQRAAVTSALPLANPGIGYFFNIEGRPAVSPEKAPVTWLRIVSPSYFETMGIPLLRGRALTSADTLETTPVAIISDTMARRFWPDEDPIGRHVIYSRESLKVEIVGVAGDVKFAGLGVNEPYSEMYVTYRQRPWLTMWLVTSAPEPASLASAMRHEVLSIDADQPVADVRTMDDVISESIAQPRLRTALMGAFAALALILSSIGIFGVVAWSVSQRTNEIGIRMALGAPSSSVVSMIVRQAFTLIGTGQLIGLIGALALTRVLSTFLFGVSPEDPVTFAVVLCFLGLVALAACFLAARRATRINPVLALRRD